MSGLLSSLAITGDIELLSLAAVLLLLVAAWSGRRAGRLVSVLCVAALVGAGIMALEQRGVAYGGLVRDDAFASFAKSLIYLAAAATLMMAPRWFTTRRAMTSEFPLLILFSAIGMALMASAGNFLSLYVGLELQSLSAYVLAAYWRADQKSAEAGLKYFVLGALASGILLFGISLVYGFTGTTDFLTVRAALAGGLPTGALFGLVFVLAGLAFKISAVPFHMWTPDVYEGAPTPVTAFFASAPKVAAIVLTVRVMVEAFGGQLIAWRQILIFVSLASIIVGAAGAIGQRNLKRLLAYSSINNVGFILIGLAAGTRAGVAGVLVYLAIYVVMTVGSFACLMLLGDRPDGSAREMLADIAGLSRTRLGLAIMLATFMFSLAGIPPLLGFWAKLVVFQAAVAANLLPLAVLGIAASVIGAYYYLMVVKTMFFDLPPEAEVATAAGADSGVLTVIAAAAALAVSPLGFLMIGPIGDWARVAASALI